MVGWGCITLLCVLSQVTLTMTEWFMRVCGPVKLRPPSSMDRSTFALLLVPPYRSTFEIFTSVLKAPVPTFFDVTSVDRMLLVRLGPKIDSTLLHYILYLVEFHFALFAVLFVCAQAKRSYNATTNELYRMDGVTRSPLVLRGEDLYHVSLLLCESDNGRHRCHFTCLNLAITQQCSPRDEGFDVGSNLLGYRFDSFDK
ncbi:hypothetical protein H257_11060 [Aphanomyces astaci]|uniref:Uncharacterized protein n=1 Tax=Aphanomyces astaci TaxID=112090 RepID=W4G4D3_APHAT|nr:hypothetical protein H257_11060 [Aphanomyces astaci]ETV74542.1 hypothetical protein H257_11060 [Aphanomyces astaci]|eukprot:XP_009836200.1 hypothetical protein H257_11060 [Aphanomyces astaci]